MKNNSVYKFNPSFGKPSFILVQNNGSFDKFSLVLLFLLKVLGTKHN